MTFSSRLRNNLYRGTGSIDGVAFEIGVSTPTTMNDAYFQRIDAFARFWTWLTRQPYTRAQAKAHLDAWDASSVAPDFRHYPVVLTQFPNEPPQQAKDALLSVREYLANTALRNAYISAVGDSVYHQNVGGDDPNNIDKLRSVQRFDVAVWEPKGYPLNVGEINGVTVHATQKIIVDAIDLRFGSL